MKQGYWIAAILAALIGGFIIGWFSRPSPTPTTKTLDGYEEVSHETYIDTITYYEPQPRDSVVVRYETAYLPLDTVWRPQEGAERIEPIATVTPGDSARVIIPITQTTYADSTYMAWVSGYRASLDSICVFPRREVITLKKPPNRWGIGIQAGYGYGPKGFQPYFGLGISWNILNF